MKRFIINILIIILILFTTNLFSQVPRTINYQGILLGSDEEPVPESYYNITFTIYMDFNTPIWTETHTNVYIEGGLLHCILGTISPLNISFENPYYLGIRVGTDPELPRIELTSAAYCFNADRVVGHTNIFPGEGTVGIGLNIPDSEYNLHVLGLTRFNVRADASIDMSTPGGWPGIITTTPGGLRRDIIFTDNSIRLLTSSSSSAPGAANGITIDNDGNVGIGLNSPNDKLSVVGVISSTTGGFRFPDGTIQNTAATGGGTDCGWTRDSSKGIVKLTNPGDNIGIGTNSPNSTVEIYQDTNDFIGLEINNPNTGSKSSEGIYLTNEEGTIAGLRIYDDDLTAYPSQMHLFNNRTNGSIHFSTQGLSKMVLDNSGNLGIGTNNPQQKLHVNGLVSFDLPSGQINFSTPGGNPGIIAIAPNGHRRDMVFTNYGIRLLTSTSSSAASTGIDIIENGNVGINANPSNNILTVKQNSSTDPIADAWTVYSSKRWKTNIESIDGALNKVQRLRGVSFDWKENGKHDIGLIAEEVGEVIPEIVVYEENGKDAQSVDYSRLVAVLIGAVQEQQREIDELKKTVRMLSSN